MEKSIRFAERRYRSKRLLAADEHLLDGQLGHFESFQYGGVESVPARASILNWWRTRTGMLAYSPRTVCAVTDARLYRFDIRLMILVRPLDDGALELAAIHLRPDDETLPMTLMRWEGVHRDSTPQFADGLRQACTAARSDLPGEIRARVEQFESEAQDLPLN